MLKQQNGGTGGFPDCKHLLLLHLTEVRFSNSSISPGLLC